MRLSVIVCSRNRAYAIRPCLDSIVASLAAAAPIEAEIVVVDNGSTDETSAVVRKWSESCAYPVRLFYEGRKGVSYARNMALREAKGDLLVWTDDDCRLSLNYVKDALRHDTETTEPMLRGGKVALGDPSDLPLTLTTNDGACRWHRSMNSARHENLGNCLLGCNMAMRRSVADRIGPFDEILGPGSPMQAGEDTDYIFRAYILGITIEFVPDMMVFHHHGRKTVTDGYKLFRGYMISAGALYAKHFFSHPNLTRQFYWDVKNACKETVSGTNTFLPEANFSNRHRVMYTLYGAAKYCLAKVGVTI